MSTPKWKKQYRQASFRKVEFFVDSANFEGGRRGPDHEFPDRDDPYADDTGRKQRKYDVQAYLLGSDYQSAKKNLIAALETKGPGDLIHPYYGNIKVVARDFTVEEKSSEGGFARITIKFTEAGTLAFPKVGADSAFLVSQAGGILSSAAQADLTKKLSVVDQAKFVVDSAAAKVEDFADKFSAATANISGTAASISELAFSIRKMKAGARDLLNEPAVLASQIDNAFSLLTKAANPSDVFKSAKSLFSFGSDDVPINRTTSTRAREATNLTALNDIVQTIAVTAASNAATDMTYTSIEDANQIRDQLGDHLDKLMENTGSDDVYSSLQSQRAQVVNAIPPSDQTLAHLSQYTPISTVPSLIVAYDLYGTIDDEQDVIDRNDIRNPAFVQGGVELEVLDRG